MIRHLKHTVSAFIFLSVLGIGERLPSRAFGVRPVTETEWVTNAGFSEKLSKCCNYIRYIFDSSSCLIVKPWNKEYSCYFHQKVKVQIISRVKIQHIATSKRHVFNKWYDSKRSIEDYPVS